MGTKMPKPKNPRRKKVSSHFMLVSIHFESLHTEGKMAIAYPALYTSQLHTMPHNIPKSLHTSHFIPVLHPILKYIRSDINLKEPLKTFITPPNFTVKFKNCSVFILKNSSLRRHSHKIDRSLS